MKYALLLAGFGLFLSFIGCKKVDITTDGEVVFFMKNDNAGDSTANFEAGKNGYYMWTSWGNYDSVSSTKLLWFGGKFGGQGPELTIRFNNSEQNSNLPLALQTGLVPFKEFVFTPPTGLKISLGSGTGWPFISNRKWIIDGQTFTTPDVILTTPDSVFEKTVRLEITDGVRVVSSTQLIRYVGTNFQGCDLRVLFNPQKQEFSFQSSKQPTFLSWMSDSLTFDTPIVPVDSFGSSFWSLAAEFSGCSAQNDFFYEPSWSWPLFDAQIFHGASLIPGVASLQPGTVEIIYVDANKRTFSTALTNQTAGHFFEITSVDEYDRNESGQKTKKLGVRFSADLKAENGDVISLKNRSGVIGVAYPD